MAVIAPRKGRLCGGKGGGCAGKERRRRLEAGFDYGPGTSAARPAR
jgi:hypothetical protein